MNRMLSIIAVGGLLGLTDVAGQSRPQHPVADRILAVNEGVVRFAFAAREDVCGDGATVIRFRDRDAYLRVDEDGGRRGWRGDRPCLDGPARVAVTVRAGRITRVRSYVGGDWPIQGGAATDLGQLAAASAAATLLELARRAESRAASELVFPATLADSVVIWPGLLALAREGQAPNPSRKAAIFWLSQQAGDAVTRGLDAFVADDSLDRELREHAVFALSQLPREEGVPALMRAARTNHDPAIRRKAMFWLGQSEDPRALALFEEILTKPR